MAYCRIIVIFALKFGYNSYIIQVSHVKKEYKEYREYKEYKTSVLLLQFIMKLIFGVNILLS